MKLNKNITIIIVGILLLFTAFLSIKENKNSPAAQTGAFCKGELDDLVAGEILSLKAYLISPYYYPYYNGAKRILPDPY